MLKPTHEYTLPRCPCSLQTCYHRNVKHKVELTQGRINDFQQSFDYHLCHTETHRTHSNTPSSNSVILTQRNSNFCYLLTQIVSITHTQALYSHIHISNSTHTYTPNSTYTYTHSMSGLQQREGWVRKLRETRKRVARESCVRLRGNRESPHLHSQDTHTPLHVYMRTHTGWTEERRRESFREKIKERAQ